MNWRQPTPLSVVTAMALAAAINMVATRPNGEDATDFKRARDGHQWREPGG